MATPEELKEWLASGFEIRIERVDEDTTRHRALIPEFAVVGEGETSNEALQAALDQLGEHLSHYTFTNKPLPDRSRWIEQMERHRTTQADAPP